MTAPALYELAEQHKQLLMLEDAEDIPPEVIRDTLDALEGDIEAKAVSVAHFIENLSAVAESIEGAVSMMEQRAARLRARAEAVRAYLLLHMQACGISKIQCPYFTLSVRNNPRTVVIDEETAIPTDYKIQPPSPPPRPDKRAILAALDAGTDVPGVHVEQRQRLDIRL